MKTFMHNYRPYVMVFVSILFLFVLSSNASANQTVKIGLIGPMKFAPGEHIWLGGSLAAEEINEAGGITVMGKKYKVEVAKADSNEILSLPDAVSAMERLITVDKVAFVVGGFNSEPVLAMQEVTADYKKIFVCTGSASEKITSRLAKDYNRYRHFFKCNATTQDSAHSMSQTAMMVADMVRQELGIKKPRIALFHEKGVWADANIDYVRDEVSAELEVVGRWAVSRTASDVMTELTAIKAAHPHIIFNCTSGPVGTPMSRSWGELKIPAALTGCNIVGQSLAHWQATNGMCNYEVTWQMIGKAESTEKTLPFYNKMVARSKEPPTYISSNSYDSVYLLKDAIERAGTLETEAVLAALEKTNYRGVIGRINFNPKDHKLPHDLKWGPGNVTQVGTQWRDGDIVVVWPDGGARLGLEGFKGLKYKGTVEYRLPPWMVKYWKEKK